MSKDELPVEIPSFGSYLVGPHSPTRYEFSLPEQLGYEHQVVRQFTEDGKHQPYEIGFLDSSDAGWTVVTIDGDQRSRTAPDYRDALFSWVK